MTYLITDPFGIGEQLILRLNEQGESVFTIYPTPKEVPMSFLGKINLKYGFFKFEQEGDLSRVLPRRVKYVIHLYDIYHGPFTTMFKANPCATLSLLDWARKMPVEKFIYLSSGEVYGQGQGVDENGHFNPINFYATTKFETEYLFRYFQKTFPITTLRVFFPFGKKVKTGLIRDLVDAIDKGKPFETNYGTISPTFANDAVDPLLQSLVRKESTVYNMCGSSIDLLALAEKIGRIINKPLKGIKTGKTVLTGSNARVVQDLAFKETPLDEALHSTFGAA
ncbi:NAD(P)-dependent oxidoreductase [candidate division WOR-3 bacterium]|nr:NAD(P)-dependent oxidoreductase [candidate division WOR-3 bacterium]